MPHLRNIKEFEQPRGQLTEQTKTQQTTKKGRTDGADERRSALTPTMKAAPFAALGTGPVTICAGKTVAQSDCGWRRRVSSNYPAPCGTSLWASLRDEGLEQAHIFQFRVQSLGDGYPHLPHAATRRKAVRRAKGVKERHPAHSPRKTSPRTVARPPWGTATGVGHAHAAPEASPRAVWRQRGPAGHASGSLATWEGDGCWLRAGEMGAAEPNSVLRPGFPADGYWLCWMRLSHFSSVTSDRA